MNNTCDNKPAHYNTNCLIRPEKDEFAGIMVDALREAGEKGLFAYDPKSFRLIDNLHGRLIYLDEAYKEYRCVSDKVRRQSLRDFVRDWFVRSEKLPSCSQELKSNLLPHVWARSTFETEFGEEPSETDAKLIHPYRSFGEHIGVGLAYDRPNGTILINQESLSAANFDFDNAFTAALETLRERSQDRLTSLLPGLWVSPWHDNYDASRFLLPDFIRSHPVKGDHIVMIPDKNTLLLTGSEDKAGLALMVLMAEEALQRTWSISGVAFRLESDSWTPFLPQVEHPLHRHFKLLQMRSIQYAYTEQDNFLQINYHNQCLETAIASYEWTDGGGIGQPYSHCDWEQRGEIILPRTDMVVFYSQWWRSYTVATWERVCEVVGDLMEPLDMYPERYRVRDFPNPEQLAAIGKTGLFQTCLTDPLHNNRA
jgi:hypothetical protein